MKRTAIIMILLVFAFRTANAETDTAVNVIKVSVFSEIRNSRDYNFVKKYLKDDNDELKIASIYVLADIDKNSASNDIKKIYNKSSYEVKRNIIYVIGEMELSENVSFLKDRLEPAGNKDISNEAITALTKINSEEVFQPLLNYLNQSPNNEHLIRSVSVMGVKAIKPLFLNLPDGDENIMAVTRRIINEIINESTFDAMTEILKLSASKIDPVKRLAKELIGERIENAIVPAVQLHKNSDGKLEEELIILLSNQTTAAREVVENLINTWSELKDDEKKIQTIDILSNYKADAYNEFLLTAIDASSDKVKKHILAKMEPKKELFADRFNIKITETDDVNMQKCYMDISIALGGGNVDTLLGLLFSLKYSSCAQQILTKIQDKKIDEHILNVLVNKENMTDFFKEKIRIILMERAPFSIETLVNGLKNKKSSTECKEILLRIGKQSIPYLVNVLKDGEDDQQIFEADDIFMKMGKMSAPYLISELKVEDLWSKMNIADILIKFKKNEVIPSLIEILESDDTGLHYRAVYGLRDFGPIAVPELIKNLKTSKENTLIGIVRSLGEIRDKSAIPPLKERLASVLNEGAKAEIEKALKKIGE